MPEVKHDASTDIETRVDKFAAEMTVAMAVITDARRKATPGAVVPTYTFVRSTYEKSVFRTPAQQAVEVLGPKPKSYVCWSAHMSDKARHVVMKNGRTAISKPKDELGSDYAEFRKQWGIAMTNNGLKNAHGRDGWGTWDEFHMELANSKMEQTDLRALACLDEYAKLTRSEGKAKNDKFEKDHKFQLTKFIEKWEHPIYNILPKGSNPARRPPAWYEPIPR